MTIERVEALWRLGLLPIARLRPIAIEAIAEGYAGPALYELADGGYGTRHEANDIFDRALREMGREPVPLEEAPWRYARVLAADIASGIIDPYIGASILSQLAYEVPDASDGLSVFAHLTDMHDADGEAHRRWYRDEMVREARRLLEEGQST